MMISVCLIEALIVRCGNDDQTLQWRLPVAAIELVGSYRERSPIDANRSRQLLQRRAPVALTEIA